MRMIYVYLLIKTGSDYYSCVLMYSNKFNTIYIKSEIILKQKYLFHTLTFFGGLLTLKADDFEKYIKLQPLNYSTFPREDFTKAAFSGFRE